MGLKIENVNRGRHHHLMDYRTFLCAACTYSTPVVAVALAQRVNIVMKLRHGHHVWLCGLSHGGERTSQKKFLTNHAFQNQVRGAAASSLPSTLFHSQVFPFNLSHKNTLARAQTFFRHPSCSDPLSLPSDLPTAVHAQTTPPLKPPTSRSKEISRPASAQLCVTISKALFPSTSYLLIYVVKSKWCCSPIFVSKSYLTGHQNRTLRRTPFSAVKFPSTLSFSPYFLAMFVRSLLVRLSVRPSVRPSGFFSPFFSIQSSLSLAPLPSQMSTFVYVNQPSCYPTESERGHSPCLGNPR